MGKKGRPGGKKGSQAPKVSASQPSNYGITRFLIRNTPVVKVEASQGPSAGAAVRACCASDGQARAEHSQGHMGHGLVAPAIQGKAEVGPMDSCPGAPPLCPLLSAPQLEPASAAATPAALAMTETPTAQPAKRARTSGGMGFLLSQNDGEEVVWHSSPLLPTMEAPTAPRDSSAYARGGPAGCSGRGSPLPSAVRHMLSTASMLKHCATTTSPPNAKPLSSALDQWLHPAPTPHPTSMPSNQMLRSLDANDKGLCAMAPSPPLLLTAATPPLKSTALKDSPAAGTTAHGTGRLEGPSNSHSLKLTPPTSHRSPEGQPCSNGYPPPSSEERARPLFTVPAQPAKKVLLELLDRVESAVRQRRLSGSPRGVAMGVALRPLLLPCLSPATAAPSIRRDSRHPLHPIPEDSDCDEAASGLLDCTPGKPSGSPCAGSEVLSGGDGGGALGVSAGEVAQLRASFGLGEWDWQDEALLQEVRRACLAAEETAAPYPSQPNPKEEAQEVGANSGGVADVVGAPAEQKEEDGEEGKEEWDGGGIECRVEVEGGGCFDGGGVDRALLHHHFVVRQVEDSSGGDWSTSGGDEKVLRVVNALRGDKGRVVLQGSWADCPVHPGDRVSVLGEWAVDPTTLDRVCVVSSADGLLVHHPDTLVKASKVGTASSCLRRFVLEERLHGDDMGSAALLGTLLHALFQAALVTGDFSSEGLENEAWEVVQQAREKLYAANENEQSALAHLTAGIPAIQQWAHAFLRPAPTDGPETVIDFGVEGPLSTAVTQVVDIEESVWSPLYGLKGKIDMSMLVATRGRTGNTRTAMMPFELKTGKKTTGYSLLDHRAQVVMYALLMGDRYQEAIPGGLLFHSHTARSLGVPVQRSELVSLVQRRNELAAALVDAACSPSSAPPLPPVLQEDWQCQRCPQLQACAVYHQAVQVHPSKQAIEDDPIENVVVADAGRHLTARHSAFFRHWEDLINREERDTQMEVGGLWRDSGRERQAAGECLAALRMVGEPTAVEGHAAQNSARAHTLVYHFQPHGYKAQEGPLHEGEYVLLSTEGDHAVWALSSGVIVTKDATGIKVSVPSALRLPPRKGLSGVARLTSSTWRLDRSETCYHSKQARSLLVSLLGGSGDVAARRRALIVDHQAPHFDNFLLPTQDPALAYCRQLAHINDDQRNALNKVLTARDYCCVLGMPGTGKTSTICHAVRALLARGASVLVTSHTNSAVDNILAKLIDQGVECVRVGRVGAIHPTVQHVALDNPGTAPATVAALEARVSAARVVGSTCLGVTHPLFRKRTFDVCIVDEASQITLPAVLGPLHCARMFVLVGDHHQLPPLVKSDAAREGGLDVSLFKMLCEAHPSAVAALATQYRMAADIMLLSNTLVYSHRLRCATPGVATARLSLAAHPPPTTQDTEWLRQAVDPLRRVVFLDTDSLGGAGQEVRQQGATHNMTEAALVAQVVDALASGGVSMGDVGVISPYQAQAKLIARLTPERCAAGLEVHTVDKYQGRDKDCIVVSFVRSNREKKAGPLLADARRINVALTRAKKKLVLIGSASTLSAVPLLRVLVALVLDNRWLVCMPAGLLARHPLQVPRDDKAAMRLAAHVQQSLSQREASSDTQPERTQTQTEAGETGPSPMRYSPKEKLFNVFNKAVRKKGQTTKRKPLQTISDNVARNTMN